VSVDPTEGLRLLAKFADGDLTETLARIEGMSGASLRTVLLPF
jgi:hypothetical protein